MSIRYFPRHGVVLGFLLTPLLLFSSGTATPTAVAEELITTHVEISSVGSTPLTYNSLFSIRGQVTYTDPEDAQVYAAPGGVVLDRQFAGESEWSTIDNDDMSVFYPVFYFRLTATHNATYRINFLGDDRYAPATDTVTVKVARKVTAKLTEPRENVFYLSGRVSPTYIGQPVTLMRRKCSSCAWRAYTTKATSELSRYRFKLPLPESGSYYFRARVPGDLAFVKTFSSSYQVMRLF